ARRGGVAMPSLLENVFASLDRVAGQLPLSVILDWFGESNLSIADVADYLVFRPEHYVRNRLHDGPAYQALVLCWRNGQRSPIHNHRSSHCGVKVLRGVATESLFARAPNGMIFPVGSRDLAPGHVCASVDEDIHQVSNLPAGGA